MTQLLHPGSNGQNGHTVLIVEDEPEIADLLRILFSIEGYRPLVATNNAEARSYLNSLKPDVLILDVMMPDDSGLDLCRFVRNTPRLADLPVVIVSARTEDEDVKAGLEAGANAYLKKPIAKRLLLRTVRQYVSREGSAEPSESSLGNLELTVRWAIVEVKRYLADIARAQAAYQAFTRRVQQSHEPSLPDQQASIPKAAEKYQSIVRENEAAGWEILEENLRRLEIREYAIRRRGGYEPVDEEEWQIASARGPFVVEDCRRWVSTNPNQIAKEYEAALEEDNRIYAYLLERYGEQALEEANEWDELFKFRASIHDANPPDQAELEVLQGYYDLLNDLRVQLSGVHLPDALVLVQGSLGRGPGEHGDSNGGAPLEDLSLLLPAR